MSQHSPAPWSVEPCRSKLAPMPLSLVVDAYRARVAVLGSDAPFSDAEANGRLIAAAPDLLAACQGIADWYISDPPLYDIGPTLGAMSAVINAISKATGGQP